jgi:hypothetical protein
VIRTRSFPGRDESSCRPSLPCVNRRPAHGEAVGSDQAAWVRRSLLVTCWHATRPQWGTGSCQMPKLECHVSARDPPVAGRLIGLSAKACVHVHAMRQDTICPRRSTGSHVVGSASLCPLCGPYSGHGPYFRWVTRTVKVFFTSWANTVCAHLSGEQTTPRKSEVQTIMF